MDGKPAEITTDGELVRIACVPTTSGVMGCASSSTQGSPMECGGTTRLLHHKPVGCNACSKAPKGRSVDSPGVASVTSATLGHAEGMYRPRIWGRQCGDSGRLSRPRPTLPLPGGQSSLVPNTRLRATRLPRAINWPPSGAFEPPALRKIMLPQPLNPPSRPARPWDCWLAPGGVSRRLREIIREQVQQLFPAAGQLRALPLPSISFRVR